MLYGDAEWELEDEEIVLDWITNHPTTMSEAAGHGVKEWKFFLYPDKSGVDIPGVECLGFSPAVQYRYVQPETQNSKKFSSFLDDRHGELTGIEGPSLDVMNSEFVPPSQSDLYEHIAGYGAGGPAGGRVSNATYAGLFKELCGVENWSSEITGWLNPALLPQVKVPSRTSPGIRWKRLGYKTKKEALMPAIVEASRLVRRMCDTGESYDVPPAGVAGRGKRVSMSRDMSGPSRKDGRLIVMPDLVRHLIGTMAAGPYMSELKKLDKSKGGILLGMGPFSESYQQISEWASGADKIICLDFKNFDHRLPGVLLKKVMEHVASRFSGIPGSAAYWKSEYRHLVETTIAMPDGRVFRKRRGVASGDPWTSIAGSTANWIILRHLCNLVGLNAKIWTFGDDSVIAVYGDSPKTVLSDFEKLAWREFGMVISPTKSYVTRHLVTIDDDPEEKSSGSFLSLYFLATESGVRPTRPLDDLYEMFLVPERWRDDLAWEIVRTSMAYLTFYYNWKARYVLEEYWDWLHHRYKVPELTGTAEDLRILREMDIPWSSFRMEWLNRLPRPAEVELMYKYGHVGFFPPLLWSAWYSKYDSDVLGNTLSFGDYERH